MYTIGNNELRITINPKGAELTSILSVKENREYLWQGNPAFWAKHSPILFPIIGTLKNNSYYFENTAYQLGRHGFARDQIFSVTTQPGPEIIFSLESNPQTLKSYPFPFRLDIIYRLQGRNLGVTYRVVNTGGKEMFFSVGGHPAFNLPLAESTLYNDYYLEFNAIEDAVRWPISAEGLIENAPSPLISNSNYLPLTKSLFYNDALVFKKLHSTRVSLKCRTADLGFEFDFTGFPYLGVWAARDADFVCIEPWCGIADSVSGNGQLTEKEGINRLLPGLVFDRHGLCVFFNAHAPDLLIQSLLILL